MFYLVFAVDPTLAAWGNLAAIIICLYAVVFVLLAVAFNLAMAFGLGWLREKAEIIKRLRPTVDSVNHTTELAERGVEPEANTNKIVRSIAQGPVAIHTIDKKVDEGADRVAHYAVEFHARTEQVKAIARTLFMPRRAQQISERASTEVDGQGLQFSSPGYRALMSEKVSDHQDTSVPLTEAPVTGTAVTASQLKK